MSWNESNIWQWTLRLYGSSWKQCTICLDRCNLEPGLLIVIWGYPAIEGVLLKQCTVCLDGCNLEPGLLICNLKISCYWGSSITQTRVELDNGPSRHLVTAEREESFISDQTVIWRSALSQIKLLFWVRRRQEQNTWLTPRMETPPTWVPW